MILQADEYERGKLKGDMLHSVFLRKTKNK
jgi:hypothetical protein